MESWEVFLEVGAELFGPLGDQERDEVRADAKALFDELERRGWVLTRVPVPPPVREV